MGRSYPKKCSLSRNPPADSGNAPRHPKPSQEKAVPLTPTSDFPLTHANMCLNQTEMRDLSIHSCHVFSQQSRGDRKRQGRSSTPPKSGLLPASSQSCSSFCVFEGSNALDLLSRASRSIQQSIHIPWSYPAASCSKALPKKKKKNNLFFKLS